MGNIFSADPASNANEAVSCNTEAITNGPKGGRQKRAKRQAVTKRGRPKKKRMDKLERKRIKKPVSNKRKTAVRKSGKKTSSRPKTGIKKRKQDKRGKGKGNNSSKMVYWADIGDDSDYEEKFTAQNTDDYPIK
ncbi:uncharacterized protein LOC119666497 [Teleopsis dalmanni]|uniref:uncharacterized protein LOC119666492 n=1 Tax=Teleopsis dalmanni TaxID=139649 RepID=UPI0018CDD851|nr:uncharacterized protein LOC119666492 [Teleopsis dalmanni]XP_037931706.1 uncharacterized protein LOC119666497 [Teleopsis dalmanni]